jgi:hypothetical protein
MERRIINPWQYSRLVWLRLFRMFQRHHRRRHLLRHRLLRCQGRSGLRRVVLINRLHIKPSQLASLINK